MDLNFLDRFSKDTHISNLSGSRVVSWGKNDGHADRRTDMTKLIVTFSNFMNAPNKTFPLQVTKTCGGVKVLPPFILNSATRLMWVINVTFRSLYFRCSSSRGRMGGPQNRTRYFVEGKRLLPLLESTIPQSSSLQPDNYNEYVIAACAFFAKPNLNLILFSFCSSEVSWSALSNLLKENSVMLLSVKLNLWQ
jgi:hypothetical protein